MAELPCWTTFVDLRSASRHAPSSNALTNKEDSRIMVQSPPSHPPPSAPLPTHIPHSFAQQPVKSRRVWVRLTTGSSGSGIAPERALNLGSGIALYQVSLPAPGDVATLRRAVWAWSGQTFLGLVATDLRVSIRGHVLDDNVPLDGHGAERDAPFDVHLAAERAAEQVRFVWPAPSPFRSHSCLQLAHGHSSPA